MERLQKQFDCMASVLSELQEKIQQGTFLSQADQAALHEASSALWEEQSRIQALLESDTESVASIQEAEALFERRREKARQCRQLRQLVEDFQRLQSLDARYQNELDAFQKRLAAYSDEELQTLDAEGGLEPYRCFLACTQLEDPDYDRDVDPLISVFGMALSLAIMGRKIIFPEGEAQARPAMKTEPVLAEPAGKAVPAPRAAPAVPKPLPPLTDLAALGSLDKGGTRKQPKGIKVLQSMCSGSADLIHVIFEFPGSQYNIVVESPIVRTGNDPKPDCRKKALDSLTREGYALRCTLKGEPGQVVYSATEAGQQTFRKFLDKLKRNRKNLDLPASGNTMRMDNAADFIRVFEGRRRFSKAFDLDALFGALCEETGVSFIQISEKEDGPLLALIFPAALFTGSDPEESLNHLLEQLDQLAKDAEPGCKVFLASVDRESCAGWTEYLLPHLPADAEIFHGLIGEDLFTAPDGTELSLSDYMQELNARRRADTGADEPPCEHIPGEAVRENVTEPTCTEEGYYDEAVFCETCGLELSRRQKTIPKKDHRPGPAIRENAAGASCTEEGRYEEVIRCRDCGTELSRDVRAVPKKAHSPGPAVRRILSEPSCTEEGLYEDVVRCRDCGAELSREQGAFPKTEHVPGPMTRENIVEPTAAGPGSYEEVICCSVCGAELSRRVKTIPALGTLEENQLSEMHQNMYRLFVEEKFPSALTMSRALGLRHPKLKGEYLQYAYAFNDPACPKHYLYSELQTVFSNGFGQDPAADALGLAAHLRLFFSSDAAVESYYLRDIMNALEQNLMFQKIPELKNVFYDLVSCYTRTNRLLDAQTMSALVDDKRNSSLRDQYQKEASRFLAGKPDESRQMNRRVNNTFRYLFGAKSPLRMAIEWVACGDETRTVEIQNTLGRFLKGDALPTGICEEKHLDRGSIESYVEDVWDSTRDRVAKNRNENFRDPARATAINRVAELIKLSLSWVALGSGGAGISDEDWSFLDTQRRKISRKMGEAAALCAGCQAEPLEDQAAFHILAATLERLSGYLMEGCALNEQKYFYLEFLRDNRVEVDTDCIPYLEDGFDEIAPLNLCKRILKHSESPLPEWPEVIKRIFEEADEGCDFGHAELIRNYLLSAGEEIVWPENYSFERSIEFAAQRMDEESRRFQAQLDLAENYGWVDDTSRIDHILADMEKRQEHYLSTQNFGFYFRTTEACKEVLKREAEQHRTGYEIELSRLRAEKGAWPIFDEVQRLISEQMYTVAQDYMDQARAGQDKAPQSTYLAQKEDLFSQYLNKYDILLSNAREASERKITEIYNRKSKSRSRNIARTGELLLSYWPRSVSPEITRTLKKFFECLGLPVEDVEQKEHNCHYMVKFLRQGRKVNYPHPIGAYGTVMQENGLHVFLTFGNCNDNAMNAELQRIMSIPLGEQEPAIVLADMAITLPERRSLAHKLKSQSKISPYLMVDRVLLFHLAEFRQEERWDVLLRCTLPFHAYNPYTESSIVELCPEMFIGRQRELNSIVDSGGANIIYGGRQLGKTALLQRAKNLKNIREDGQWAFYLDIRNRSVEDAARLIYEMLLDDNFLQEPDGVEIENISWDQLTRKIIRRMNDERQYVKSLLLLLDEADAFLYSCGEGECAYEPIVSLKRIQSRTNRFKFVLAGLHNVMRFNKKAAQNDDSPIPHLAPITMRPLPFHEARELIELPLSYLGYKVRPENDYLIVQILSSTNYFPGLIQYYCSSLVNTANQNYRGDANERPPYWLEEAQILTLLKDKKFQENIKSKFEITLGVDENEKGYYKTLAYALARCYFSRPENLASGYTAEEICTLCRQLDIHSITELEREQVAELLDELIDLNVLRSRSDGTVTRYIFNRASFRHMLGGEQEVDDELERIMEKEANAHV